jgi:hypothetical protein
MATVQLPNDHQAGLPADSVTPTVTIGQTLLTGVQGGKTTGDR